MAKRWPPDRGEGVQPCRPFGPLRRLAESRVWPPLNTLQIRRLAFRLAYLSPGGRWLGGFTMVFRVCAHPGWCVWLVLLQ
jgi:hypothetical protein